MILATALLWFAQATQDSDLPRPTSSGQIVIEVLKGHGADGEDLWNITALNVRLTRLLREIADKQGVTLELDETIERSTLVTAQLEKRELKTVLEFVLGSVELHGEVRGLTLAVNPISDLSRDPRYTLIQAQVAFLQAVKSFGNAPQAPDAYMSLAEIAELLDNPAAAQINYEAITDTYPDSPLALEAILRSGRLYKREGDIQEAATQFETLISRGAADFESTAYLELAACKVDLFLPTQSIALLKSLEINHPTNDPPTVLERQLVLASALNGKGDWFSALRALHEAELGNDPHARHAQYKIMAIALNGIGRKEEASQAWVMYADSGAESEKAFGYAQAALLALENKNAFSAIFITQKARVDGVMNAELESYEKRGLAMLEIDEAAGPAVDIGAKLARIEQLISERKFDPARQPLNQMMRGRGTLKPAEAQRVVILSARLAAGRMGVDEGLTVLRAERAATAQLEARKPLDLEAARLLEKANRWAEAADAYSGQY